MLLHTACLTLALTVVGSAPPSVRFCPLEKSIQGSAAIVSGRIVAIRAPRTAAEGGWTSGGEYVLAVARAFAGPLAAGERVVVAGCGDWTCESRSVEYAVGQELLLFLARGDGALHPTFGFQSELLVAGGEVRESTRARGFAQDAPFLDGLPELIRFARLPRADQDAAWLALLRHANPELRQFALRRFHEVFFLGDDLGVDAYAAIPDELLAALFAEVVRLIPADAGRRGASMRALENLWRHVLDERAGLRGELDASRLEAIERLRALPADASERERCESTYLRARLGALDALPAVLDALRGADHDGHFDAFAALEQLAETTRLRRREVFDVLADHPASTRCEAALGRTAESVVRASGAALPAAAEGATLRDRAAAFRRWWSAQRDSFAE